MMITKCSLQPIEKANYSCTKSLLKYTPNNKCKLGMPAITTIRANFDIEPVR